MVHLPDVHLRASDRGRAGAHHPQHLHAGVRGPTPLLRLAAEPPGRPRPAGPPAAATDRIRPAQPELRRHQQAQAAPARRGEARQRLGRPAHADAGRPAPPRLHAREHPRDGRGHRCQQAERLDRRHGARPGPARRPGAAGAARLRGAAAAQAQADELRRGVWLHRPPRTLRDRRPPAQTGAGGTQVLARPRAVDRGRGLRGGAAQGLLPAVPATTAA
mmetsp:Transcript_5508/g.13226  ORF Transcript_5508/g.13226 Transcript_5508/m.13226 type:complete len:218 (+) Transcript_5508:2151-2804(+)